jgi:HEAT repeats
MKDCSTYQALITRVMTGELRDDEQLALQGHCHGCPECAALLAAHEEIEGLGDTLPEITDAESAHLRDAVMSRLRPAGPKKSFWADLRSFLNLHPMAAAPVVAVGLLAVFVLGRWSVPSMDQTGDQFMAQLNRQAATRQTLNEYLDNPLTYTNVSARPRGNRLALSFDVRRHVELETGLDSPLARDVLLAALVDDKSTGARMRAMQLAPMLRDDSLREALVFTLQNDPDLAVRMEAVDALIRYPDAPEVRDALLQTLKSDPAVQMRLVALEHLNERQVDAAVIRQAISTNELEGDAAVLQQALQWQRRES